MFDLIPSSDRNDKVILWNQMIRAYAWKGPFEKAIDLYYEMVENGVRPTNYTYPFVIKACSALQDVENGVEIHEHVKRQGLVGDVYICTALVDFMQSVGCWLRCDECLMGCRGEMLWHGMR